VSHIETKHAIITGLLRTPPPGSRRPEPHSVVLDDGIQILGMRGRQAFAGLGTSAAMRDGGDRRQCHGADASASSSGGRCADDHHLTARTALAPNAGSIAMASRTAGVNR
jgi:hypothetical protein